jgi:hypothetical protein
VLTDQALKRMKNVGFLVVTLMPPFVVAAEALDSVVDAFEFALQASRGNQLDAGCNDHAHWPRRARYMNTGELPDTTGVTVRGRFGVLPFAAVGTDTAKQPFTREMSSITIANRRLQQPNSISRVRASTGRAATSWATKPRADHARDVKPIDNQCWLVERSGRHSIFQSVEIGKSSLMIGDSSGKD